MNCLIVSNAKLKSLFCFYSPFDLKNPFLSTVLVKRELYKGERSCMHIELDITGGKLR